MPRQTPEFQRLFTLDEANAMLPLVRAIVTDLQQLTRDIVDRRERLAMLRGDRDPQRNDLYSEELSQVEDELEKDARQIRAYVEELLELGVEPKDGLEGLVDFPCQMDGRVVYLCWKLGESEVQYWHDLDAGFAGRQSLTVTSGDKA
ncbi:MAG: DUF2203 domain-containing protein [Pirellulales bacterium]|nr:DUF2203 domain-containing protein [Pirellulales bacterium]